MSDFSIDNLSEETQTYIKGLRQEAAGYRTERNAARTERDELKNKYSEAGSLLSQANTQLDQMKTLESTSEAAVKNLTSLQEKYDRLTAIAPFKNLTQEDADRLKGAKPEEWAADAKALSERIGGVKPGGVPKDDAAGKTPPEPKDDAISAAFRKAGLL